MRISTISKIPIPDPNTPSTSDTPAKSPKMIEPIIVINYGTLMFEVAKENGLKDRDELRKNG